MIAELKVSAHLMTLDRGLFCVFLLPGQYADQSGLPGVRITRAPNRLDDDAVSISAFRSDGWLGPREHAALVRVDRGPAQVLVTVYQMPNGGEPPKLQVMRLTEAEAERTERPVLPPPAMPAARPAAPPMPSGVAEVGAHVQGRGDVAARLGEWIGDRGSRRWIEGFAVAPASQVAHADIEYQALLGRGWLSPWAEGGQFCGSRGMALPILGLRIKLRGAAAASFDCVYTATFTDGSQVGPVTNGQPCEAPSLAPLEAFQLMLQPRQGQPMGYPGVMPAGHTAYPAAAPARPRSRTPAAPADPAPAKPASPRKRKS